MMLGLLCKLKEALESNNDALALVIITKLVEANALDQGVIVYPPPLILAVRQDKIDLMKIILKHGANVNVQNASGFTALMSACWRNNIDCVKLLLQNGANVDVQDSLGSTALMRACEYGRNQCVELLLEANACINLRDQNDDTALDIARRYGHKECVELLVSKRMYDV